MDNKIRNILINSLKYKSNFIKKRNSGKDKININITSRRNSEFSSLENQDKIRKIKNKENHSTSNLIKIKKNNIKRVSFLSPIINRKKSLPKNNILSNINNITNKYKKEENAKNTFYNNPKNKKGFFNMKKPFNYDKYKDPLILLYDNIKNKPQIKKEDVDDIKKYLTSKGKTINLNFHFIDFFKQVKRITDHIDIERKTKRVFHPFLTYKQIQKLDEVTKINSKVYGLDIDYMNHIFDFKSSNSESIQANLE